MVPITIRLDNISSNSITVVENVLAIANIELGVPEDHLPLLKNINEVNYNMDDDFFYNYFQDILYKKPENPLLNQIF